MASAQAKAQDYLSVIDKEVRLQRRHGLTVASIELFRADIRGA